MKLNIITRQSPGKLIQWIFLAAFLTLTLGVSAQVVDLPAKAQNQLDDAEFLFEDESYLRALIIYDSLSEAFPGQPYLRYQTARCLINKINGRKRAFEIMSDLNGLAEYKDAKFYMARAQHLLYEFDQAEVLYNQFLDEAKPSGNIRTLTNHYLKNCATGREIMARRIGVELELLGPPSNDTNSQYSPILSSDGTKLFFVSRGPSSTGGTMTNTLKKKDVGHFYEDIFVSELQEDSTWSEGVSIGQDINTIEHEAPTSISKDGKRLLLYRSGKTHKEDVYESNLMDNGQWSKPNLVKGVVNSVHWEGSASLNSDANKIYFSSDRPGGYGGRDIYTAEALEDGSWGNIQNLGDVINTQFDDDSPFIYSDDKSLYFSSEGHSSMGGHDLFYTKVDSNGKWSPPVNIGYPINTTDDDRYYVVSSDGKLGLFSSARANGENLHDIYAVRPGAFENMVKLVLLYGTVYVDDKPRTASIEIVDETTGKVLGVIISDSTTGEFNYSLLPGRKYKLTMTTEGADPLIEYIDVVDNGATFIKVTHHFRIYTFEYKRLNGDPTELLSLQKELDDALIQDGGVVLHGVIKKDDVPSAGRVLITHAHTRLLVADLQADPKTGKFQYALLPGNRYQITVEVEGTDPLVRFLDVPNMPNTFIRLDEDFYVYTFVYEGLKHDQTEMSLQDALDKTMSYEEKRKLGLLKGIDPKRNFLTEEETALGLYFRVQVGAYRNPGRFNYDFLRGLGSVQIKGYPDGITRYLMGPKFTTRKEANVLRLKCIMAGQTDAWITIR